VTYFEDLIERRRDDVVQGITWNERKHPAGSSAVFAISLAIKAFSEKLHGDERTSFTAQRIKWWGR